MKLGDIALRGGDVVGAGKSFRRALELREQLAADAPRNMSSQRELSIAYGRLGDVAQLRGDRRDARANFEKALERMESLAQAHSGDVQLRHDRAVAQMRLGVVNRQLGEHSRAREHLSKALEDFEQMAAADPDNVPAQIDLAGCLMNCGNVEKTARDFVRSAGYFERGIAILLQLKSQEKLATQPQLQGLLRDCQSNLDFCNEVVRTVANLDHARTKPPNFAAQLLTQRAQVLADRGQHSQAAETAERLREVAPEDPVILYNIACCYARCMPLVAPKTPADQLAPEARALRTRYAERAIAALKESIKRGFKDVKLLESDSDLAAIRDTNDYRQVLGGLKAGP
jgi:tetratricopeptide (TPR) repeat protein